jgi:hypothetical protein
MHTVSSRSNNGDSVDRDAPGTFHPIGTRGCKDLLESPCRVEGIWRKLSIQHLQRNVFLHYLGH